ncbi:MAG: PIN domain-containing protein [Caldilineaceae bacterium]|nr:PIN domain-containing protein [Caldilineaceae bacterium]
MQLLLDTSVMLAALLRSHPAHSSAYPWLKMIKQREHTGHISTHSLAELYNKLTRVPLSRPIPPAEALAMLTADVTSLMIPVALSYKDYLSVVNHLADRKLVGGIIYDALIVRAGIKAGVDRILTLNPCHFRLIYPEAEDRIVDPSAESAP